MNCSTLHLLEASELLWRRFDVFTYFQIYNSGILLYDMDVLPIFCLQILSSSVHIPDIFHKGVLQIPVIVDLLILPLFLLPSFAISPDSQALDTVSDDCY